MSKFGVGVGEDFPIDEGKPQENGPGSPGSGNADQGKSDSDEARRARHRARHEEHGARRAEWRARKRAFRHDIRRSMREHFGDHPFTDHNGTVLRVLVGAALVGLAVALLPTFFVITALVLVVIFFAAHHGGFHRHHHYPHHDADA